MIRRWICLAVAVLGLCGCGAGNAIDPDQDAKEAVRQQKDCNDPQWKAAHLGIWYSVCRPSATTLR